MLNRLKQWREERGLFLQADKTKHFGYICEEVSEGLRAESEHDVVDAYADIVVFAINAIEQHGYDAELVMSETIKEIESRKGEINPITKKFEKYKDEHSVSKWVKADYSRCKRDNIALDFNKINIAKSMKIIK